MANELQSQTLGGLLGRADVAAARAALERRLEVRRDALTEGAEPNDDLFDYHSLRGIMYTSLNGQSDIKDQNIRVEYLTTNQVLVIPSGLGISYLGVEHSHAEHNAALVALFIKATQMSYRTVKSVVDTAGNIAAKRKIVTDLPAPTGDIIIPNWTSPAFYQPTDATHDGEHIGNLTYGLFSRIMGLNFDIRDLGFLTMRVGLHRITDNQWANLPEDLSDRFESKVRPYTLTSIAALNWEACSRWDIGAWVRSFGVGCGVLPAENTKVNKEWLYTRRIATDEAIGATRETHMRVGEVLKSLCLNIIAAFGLFHLAKNHTYKTNDANMERIGLSYILSMRTMVTPNIVEEMKANQEVVVRTAPHPFGMAQSYWLARALSKREALAKPLALRITVTPPQVQRLMIVEAATREWQNLPVASSLEAIFFEKIRIIKEEIVRIRTAPPAFSELYAFYACAEQGVMTPEAKEAADAMMPIVNGFATAMHCGENDAKDGLALAQSFANVERDNKALTQTYTSLWKNYIATMETAGLEKFLRRTYNLAQEDQATRGVNQE